MINTADGNIDSWMDPQYANATYDHDNDPKTPEIPWPDVNKRYATVVSRIDQQVGDLLQLLKDLNIDSNALVIFTSDNGPSQESYLNEPYTPEFLKAMDHTMASKEILGKEAFGYLLLLPGRK
jgi:Arylsulfatase A and related enzymes